MSAEPRLKLVDAALADVPHAEKDEPILRKMIAAFGPSIAKRARADERAAIFASVGARTIEDLQVLPRLKAELREGFEREEAKHVRAGFWRGAALGGSIIGAAAIAALALYTNAILAPTFDAASQARMQDSVVRQMDRAVNPPAPNYPSETP